MKKLFMLMIAATAFAMPASALAEAPDGSHFLHEGSVVEETTEIKLTGSMGWVTTGTATGMHCPHVVISADLEASGTGRITKFETPTNDCTGTGQLESLLTHWIPLGLHLEKPNGEWVLEADATNGQIDITNITIRTTITSGGVCVFEGVIQGSFSANLPDSENSTTVTLSSAPGEYKFGTNNVTISGHLTTAETSIGVQE